MLVSGKCKFSFCAAFECINWFVIWMDLLVVVIVTENTIHTHCVVFSGWILLIRLIILNARRPELIVSWNYFIGCRVFAFSTWNLYDYEILNEIGRRTTRWRAFDDGFSLHVVFRRVCVYVLIKVYDFFVM